MNNCLVTKLKAVVDNPNLPVLETMQQFTLDIIAASENSSMTDAQKWALNHFFYQIGAFAENGIYSKLSVLALPFIAGTIEGAVYNIATCSSPDGTTGASISLSDGGLIASVSAHSGYYDIDAYGLTNLSAFYLGGAPFNVSNSGTTTGSQSGTVSIKKNNVRNIIMASTTYITRSTFTDVSLPQEITPTGMGFNISNSQVYGFATTANGAYKVSTPGVIYTDELTPWSITRVDPVIDATADAPIKGIMYGNGLTDDEFYKFVSALNDLFAQF